MRAKHKTSGVTVSGDEAVLRRLGPDWEQVEVERKAPAKKAAAKPSDK